MVLHRLRLAQEPCLFLIATSPRQTQVLVRQLALLGRLPSRRLHLPLLLGALLRSPRRLWAVGSQQRPQALLQSLAFSK